MSNILLNLLQKGFHNFPLNINKSIGYPKQPDGKVLLLKKQLTYVIEYAEIKLEAN